MKIFTKKKIEKKKQMLLKPKKIQFVCQIKVMRQLYMKII